MKKSSPQARSFCFSIKRIVASESGGIGRMGNRCRSRPDASSIKKKGARPVGSGIHEYLPNVPDSPNLLSLLRRRLTLELWIDEGSLSCFLICRTRGQREMEGGRLVGRALDPHAAAVRLDQPLGD